MIIYLKTEEEISGFCKAGKEAARILDKLIHYAQPGWTTNDLNNIALEECKNIGATPVFLNYNGFPAAICASKNNILVHGIPNDIPLCAGDLISIDFGIEIDGFIGDTAKTVVVKKRKTKEQAWLITQCKWALLKAINTAIPGNKLSQISEVIEKTGKKSNLLIPDIYGGHGIDKYALHAAPFVPNLPDYENDIILREGMILAIEPMFIDAESNRTKVFADGWTVQAKGDTVHFEHTIAITKDGPLVLTER